MTCQWFFVCDACYMLVLLGCYTLRFLLWHACGGHWVIAVQVYLGTWWLLWVLWVPFVTCAYDLLVSLCQNCLLDTRICVITIQKWDFSAMIGKKLKIFWCATILNSIMPRILVPTPSNPAYMWIGLRINTVPVFSYQLQIFCQWKQFFHTIGDYFAYQLVSIVTAVFLGNSSC